MIKAKYTFDGINRVGYYQQQLHQCEQKIITLKNKIDQENKGKNNPFEILKLKNKLEEMGLVTYGKSFF